jgi:hypothetical protein
MTKPLTSATSLSFVGFRSETGVAKQGVAKQATAERFDWALEESSEYHLPPGLWSHPGRRECCGLLLFPDSRLDFDGSVSVKLAQFLRKPRYVPGPGSRAS